MCLKTHAQIRIPETEVSGGGMEDGKYKEFYTLFF